MGFGTIASTESYVNQPRIRIVLACVCLIAFALPAWGQQQKANENIGILGRLDPRTGTFKPVQVTPIDDLQAEATTSTNYTGKLVYNFAITIASTIPTTSVITCYAGATVMSSYYSYFQESATVVATRSGSTAKCTVVIPYSWSLATASAAADSVTLIYNIEATSTSTTAGTLVLRSNSSYYSLGSVPIPLNGATTTKSIAATI